MRLIIHDLAQEIFDGLLCAPLDEAQVRLVADDGTIKPCAGCFGCWVRTPGECVLRDAYADLGALWAKADEVVMISQCLYGGFSPFVKNVMDRSISFLLPDFTIREGRMHHLPRYERAPAMTVYFYGEGLSDEEVRSAVRLVKANALNFGCEVRGVHFMESPAELGGKLG